MSTEPVVRGLVPLGRGTGGPADCESLEEDGALPDENVLGVWAAALQSMEEDEMAAPPAGNASTILRFNFDAPSAQ